MTQDSTEERRRKHMAVMDDKRKIEELLPDDLYDSKDWRQGDMAERVLWLIAMLESKSEEVDAWVEIANKNVDRISELEGVLKAIAADASVPVHTWKNGINFKKMYEGWRKIATSRIDIARAAIKGE
jgi:hypothetical protein